MLVNIKLLYERLYIPPPFAPELPVKVQLVTVGLLCVLTMFLIYIQQQTLAVWVFGIALILLILSLAFLIREIQISVQALEHHISDIENN